MIFKQTTWPEDYQIMVDMCSKWWPDSFFYKNFGIPFKVNREFFDTVVEAGVAVYTIGYIDNEPASCFFAIIQDYMFNPEHKMLGEIVWCIDEKFRGYENLTKLLDEIDRQATQSGCTIQSLAVSCAKEYDNLHGILNKRGFIDIDHCFMKKLKGEEDE